MTSRMKWLPFSGLLLMLVAAVGCQMQSSGHSDKKETIDVNELGPLRSFEESAEDYYQSLEELTNDLDTLAYNYAVSFIENPYPYEYFMIDDEINEASADASGYETNTQFEGIDESDRVKSDGQNIYIASGSSVYSLNKNGTFINKLEVFDGEEVEGLLKVDGKLFAVSNQAIYADFAADCIGYQNGICTTEFAIINYNSHGQLSLEYKSKVKGQSYIQKASDDTVYMTTSNFFDYWALEKAVSEIVIDNPNLEDKEIKDLVDEELNTLIPAWRDEIISNYFTNGGSPDLEKIRNTLRITNLNIPESDDYSYYSQYYFYISTIYSIKLTSSTPNVYSTTLFSSIPQGTNNFYLDNDYAVLANASMKLDENQYSEVTNLLAFKIDNGVLRYYAKGSVPGYYAGSYSMDIHDDYLRIATTSWGHYEFSEVDNSWDYIPNNRSHVSVLEMDRETLTQKGFLDNLGVNERLYAVRFMGDLGYLVTFLEIDPFYVLDLSDPSDPKVVGELEIPGFSTYLKPIDNGRILAIGERNNNIQIATYDVSNPNSPSQIDVEIINPDDLTWSDAQFDPRAFRYSAEKGILIIPVEGYTAMETYTQFSVLDIGSDGMIEERGKIQHYNTVSGSWRFSERRSLVIDETLYTIMNHQIKASNADDLSEDWALNLE